MRRSRSASRIFLFWLLELSQSHSIPHSARARVRLNTSASAYACRMSYVASSVACAVGPSRPLELRERTQIHRSSIR